MRVASFNILHGQRADRSGRVDHDALGRSAASLRADVLALQEVDVNVPRSGGADQAAVVADVTGLAMVFGKAARVAGSGTYGNVLLARGAGAITDVDVVPLPKAVRHHEARSTIVATVSLEGWPPMSVAATHLSIHRPEVHDQLKATIDALVRRPSPRLLAGDLNLLPEEVEAAVGAAGFELADAAVPTFPLHEPRLRLDYVAIAGHHAEGISIAGVEVIATESSDHCALVVDFQRDRPA